MQNTCSQSLYKYNAPAAGRRNVRRQSCSLRPRVPSPGKHYAQRTAELDKWRSSGGKAGGNLLVDTSVPEVQRGLYRRKYGTIALSDGTPTELSYQAFELSSRDVAGPAAVVYLVRNLQSAQLRMAARAADAVSLGSRNIIRRALPPRSPMRGRAPVNSYYSCYTRILQSNSQCAGLCCAVSTMLSPLVAPRHGHESPSISLAPRSWSCSPWRPR